MPLIDRLLGPLSPVSSNRWMHLDLLKLLGILAVIVVHQSAPFINHLPPDSEGWRLATMWNAVARFCVPVFIMASGAMLLDPARMEPLGRFLRKRLSKVLIPLLVWQAVYFFAYLTAAGEPFVVADFVREMVTGYGTDHIPMHLWFIPMITGLYLFTPVLQVLVRYGSRTLLWYFLAMCLLFAVVVPVVAAKWAVTVSVTAPMFTGFVGYFLLGHVLHSRAKPGGRGVVALALFGLVLSTWLLVWVVFHPGALPTVLTGPGAIYLNPLVVVMSVCVYLLFQAGADLLGSPSERWERLVAVAAPTVFGVYLIHPLVIRAFRDVVGLGPLPGGVLGLPLLATGVFMVSMAMVWAMRRIPPLRVVVP